MTSATMNVASPKHQVTAIVIGCGIRGQAYSSYALDFPSHLKIVGVADPVQHRTLKLKKLHNIECDDYVVSDWHYFAGLETKIADCAIITTPDKLHKDPAVELAKLGMF
jgi:predicted dehydrogenase